MLHQIREHGKHQANILIKIKITFNFRLHRRPLSTKVYKNCDGELQEHYIPQVLTY